MPEAFRGEFYQKVDSKARVLVPAPFRRVLEAGDTRSSDTPRTRLVVVYGGKARSFCECYSFAEAEVLAAQIAVLPPGSKQRLRAERDLVTLSATVDIDDDGRFVLPSRVREKLGLSTDKMRSGIELVMAGATNRFSLWRSDLYEAQFLAADDEEDGIDPLALLVQSSAQG